MRILRQQGNKPRLIGNKVEEGFIEDQADIQRPTALRNGFQQATLRQQEYLAAQMEDVVALEVNRATLQMDRATQRADVAAIILGQAEEQSRTTEQRFKTGLATATDLLDAEVSLQQAKMTRSGARVECEIARARLTRALGAGMP